MDEDVGIVFMLLFWATLAIAAFQRLWTIRRLRKSVRRLELEQARLTAASPPPAVPQDLNEFRRINDRLNVLERIAVEKENSLAREIEDLRVAER
jgi:hypothetical protein